LKCFFNNISINVGRRENSQQCNDKRWNLSADILIIVNISIDFKKHYIGQTLPLTTETHIRIDGVTQCLILNKI